MRKIIFITISIFVFGLAFPAFSFAQGMMGNITGANNTALQNNDGHTAREEAEGKAVWEKLQAKELTCNDLSDENYGALGEYFMGQMMGDSHEAMNNMMIQMMGKEGEEQAHIAMGKRMSNCEPDAPMPQNMMNMMGGEGMMSMMGNWSNPSALNNYSNNPMMNFGFTSFAWFGWIFMILFWVLIVVGIVALIKWLVGETGSGRKEKSALDILKERYAKGEISKEEFEEKKKDLI